MTREDRARRGQVRQRTHPSCSGPDGPSSLVDSAVPRKLQTADRPSFPLAPPPAWLQPSPQARRIQEGRVRSQDLIQRMGEFLDLLGTLGARKVLDQGRKP